MRKECAPTLVFSLLILALPALMTGQTPVPSGYQSLYSSLTTQINSFAGEINSGWNGSTTAPVAFSAQLFTANGDNGSVMLGANYLTNAVEPELNELKAMGVKAVFVAIDFPVLYPGYYTYENSTSYQSYWSFYTQVTAAIRARGLK